MDWTPGDMSSDVEDRRGDSSGGGGFQIGGGGLGIGGVVVLVIISLVTGRNYIGSFLSGDGAGVQQSRPASSAEGPVTASPEEQRSAQLVSFVLDDVQKTWPAILAQQGGPQYRRAKLVLFRGQTYSGCGTAEAATGPFYCPLDEKVYIDLGFWDELRQLGGSTADFAQAYVIAHELGHHVQNILGIEQQVRRQQKWNPSQQNQLSVDLELQADCFAGVWAHSGEQRDMIHSADIDDGMKAVAAVGDDHIQRMTQGTVSPERFTHGSSAQRTAWFRHGLESGEVKSCNTFKAADDESGSQ